MKLSIKFLIIPALLFVSFFVLCPFNTQTDSFLPNSLSVAQADFWDDQTGMDQVGEKFGEGGDEPEDVRNIIVDIIRIALSFLALIFLILTVMAGYKWMTASGNEDRIKEAKSQLSHAIIGLLIVLSALAITEFILEAFIDATDGGDLDILSDRFNIKNT
ncbi:MAG: pilin [Patescibacteria group bacterium]